MQDPGRGQVVVVVVVLKKRVLDVEQVVVQVRVQMTVQVLLLLLREHPNVVQRVEGVPSSVSAFDST